MFVPKRVSPFHVKSGAHLNQIENDDCVSNDFSHEGALIKHKDSQVKKKKKKKKKKKRRVTINLENCKYSVVQTCAKKLDWECLGGTGSEGTNTWNVEWNVYWTDLSVLPSRVSYMQPFQRINHFPGMHEIASKVPLTKNLSRLFKLLPEQYSFYPNSFVIPREYEAWKSVILSKSKPAFFIVKPSNSSQGKGIFLTQSVKNVDVTIPQVVQEYISRPLLLDGFKFDLRLYVLILSVDPLLIYLYQDGLVRLCTTPYSKPKGSNISRTSMHLTNYAINKESEAFHVETETNTGSGFKRSVKWLLKFLEEKRVGLSTQVWRNIQDVVVKTILAVEPSLRQEYRCCTSKTSSSAFSSKCFEVLGFDILLDRDHEPWLMEVNHSPSLSCSSQLDLRIKSEVIEGTLRLLNVKPTDNRTIRRKSQESSLNRLYGGQTEIRASKREPEQKKNGSQTLADQFYKKATKVEKSQSNNFERVYPSLECDRQADYEALSRELRDLYKTR